MYYGTSCADRLDGTSFAAPHTAGVGGLMLSYYKNAGATPNPLDPEDLEEVMQLTATDITAPTGTYLVGYDARSGYGRLNAGNAMQAIKFPDYMVKHYSATANVTTAVLQGSNEVTCLWKSLFGIPSGTVHVDRYKVTKSVSHSIPSGYTIAVPGQPGWERDAASNIHGLQSGAYSLFCGDLFTMPTHYLPDAPDITTTISATGATLTGYVYAIHDPSNPATKYWWPTYFNNLTGTADFEYSLYLKSLTIGIEENAVSEHALNVYPNPACDKVYISSNLNDLTKVRVTIYNVLGQVMLNDYPLDIWQPNYIDVSGLKNGIYFFHLTNGGKKVVKKVIINH
jgi:hypothetical protein